MAAVLHQEVLAQLCKLSSLGNLAQLRAYTATHGITAQDVRENHGAALRAAFQTGRSASVSYLARSYGLTADEVRASLLIELGAECARGRLGSVQRLVAEGQVAAEELRKVYPRPERPTEKQRRVEAWLNERYGPAWRSEALGAAGGAAGRPPQQRGRGESREGPRASPAGATAGLRREADGAGRTLLVPDMMRPAGPAGPAGPEGAKQALERAQRALGEAMAEVARALEALG